MKISESLAFLRDTLVYVQDKGMDTCFISLDQEKAFDRISHSNMRGVLFKMKDVGLRGVTIPGSGNLPVIGRRYRFLLGSAVLGIWFGEAGICARTWGEHIAKVRQKLDRWDQFSLSIAGKYLVISCDMLPVLLHEVQKLPGTQTHHHHHESALGPPAATNAITATELFN
eukprot:g43880.t1